jgi:hypothetical protein
MLHKEMYVFVGSLHLRARRGAAVRLREMKAVATIAPEPQLMMVLLTGKLG